MGTLSFPYAGFISFRASSPRFFMGFGLILWFAGRMADLAFSGPCWTGMMAFGSDHAVLLDRLDEAVRFAPKPTRDLFAKIVASACTRVPILTQSGKATELGRLVESAAWADAALVLVELELPDWRLRRLICEDGVWLCSLSRQPNLPAALDDTADGSHEVMPLAIVRAFVQARRMAVAAPRSAASVPTVEPSAAEFVCCENFA